MADITNPEAIRFVNEQIRPMAEKVRALKVTLDDLSQKWFSGINTIIGTGSGIIQDGRDAEGISRLTQDDIANFIAIAVNATLPTVSGGSMAYINKPCVRSLDAN